jgi:hypothetical protein
MLIFWRLGLNGFGRALNGTCGMLRKGEGVWDFEFSVLLESYLVKKIVKLLRNFMKSRKSGEINPG